MDNNEMLEAYLFEANSLLEELDDTLINCEKSDHFDDDSINKIFRIMHTIKGSSAMMEFGSIATVSHKVEDLFAYVRENGINHSYNPELFELMFKSSDFLKSEIDCVQQNTPLTNNIGNFEAEINTFLKKISSGEPAAASVSSPDSSKNQLSSFESSPINHSYHYAIKVFFDEDAQMENLRAFMLVNAISDVCPDVKHFPEDLQGEHSAEEIAMNGFLLYFPTEQDLHNSLETLERFVFIKKFDFLNEQPQEISQQETSPSDTVSEALPSSDTSPATASSSSAAASSAPTSSTSLINVNLTKLDKLMDLMGEIVITESMVTSIPTAEGVDIDNFTKAARQLQKLTDELQENVMSIRMVPVSSVFQKMRRIVRDMSKKLGKDVELVLEGEDTEVDKTIVDNIADPLMHLVRNSMDHGIENTDVRIAKGKPAKGTIKLTAQNTGGEILVTVEDDGKGFDKSVILKKAKERGLLKKAENEYSSKEIYSFLLMPGFSTKEQVTEFSGRGVGMDVVKKNIETIGGDVTLDSQKDQGTLIQFKIPLTLAIVTGMKISVGDSILIVPINNIRQTFKAEEQNILHDTENREIIMIRDEYYPLIRLHNIYDMDTEVTDLTKGIIILVESDDFAYCVFADALLGEQQVVIKPLPAYVTAFKVKEHGIAGCAILADGSISLILDILSLYSNKEI